MDVNHNRYRFPTKSRSGIDQNFMFAKSFVRTLDWHLSICMIRNCCGKLLKDRGCSLSSGKMMIKLIVCVLRSGGVSDIDANFGSVLRILASKPVC